MLAPLPFFWLVARDVVHLAFADKEETQRIVYNVLIPGLYAALDRSDRLPPWRFGIGALMANLAGRGLLGGSS